MNKLTKSQYHQSLSPAFVAWRKAMHVACSVKSDMYLRLYTEKRSHGARTKYYSHNHLPNIKIAKYIAQNPTFSAGSAGVFKVTFKTHFYSASLRSSDSRGLPIQSAALFCSKANTIK